ncbi:MAG: ParB/RepB/Spo0J family partition protein, partial [Rickettsiales bacterium]|nr:ParB/RepB/Spo0J family partition protein [Rickettsiales bacterium]
RPAPAPEPAPMPAAVAPETGDRLRTLPIDVIERGRYQPRIDMRQESLQELADSIKAQGVVQPIVVRPLTKPGLYEIIAGERRWKASRMAGLSDVPVIIRELSDREALEIGLVENIQRQDLTPIEVAEGYQRLIQEFGYTHEALSEVVGKSSGQVSNMIRLLGLPVSLKDALNKGTLTTGHARALLAAEDPEALANVVLKRDLNVRQTEALVKQAAKYPRMQKRTQAVKDDAILAIEKDLARSLGMPVTIQPRGERGTVSIQYHSQAELHTILKRLDAEEVAPAPAVEIAAAPLQPEPTPQTTVQVPEELLEPVS